MNDSQAIFSQLDSRWSRQKIGSSVLTIGGYGCTLTSTCRSLFLLTGKLINPSQMEDTIKFTDSSNPQGPGLIIWESFNRIGLKALRVRKTKPKNFKRGMLLELNYLATKGVNHWVCFDSISDDEKTVKVMDPWVGEIVSKPIYEICGFTEVEAIDAPVNEPTEWEKEVKEATEWVKEKGISNGERPKDFLTREEQWVMNYRLAKKLMEWVK